MEKNKLTILNGAGNPDLTKDAVRKLRADLPVLLQIISINASLTRAKFEALKLQGFNDAEALELSKKLF